MAEFEPLTTHQRRLQIAQQVQEQGSVRVSELARHFQVSDTAIRRDLSVLEERQLLRRSHGGALATMRLPSSHSFLNKQRQQAEAKCCIGRVAASMVSPGDSLVLDSGSTVLEVALALSKTNLPLPPLTIVTNSLPVLLAMQEMNAVNLNVLGGLLLPEYQAMVGPQAVANLRRLQVDLAIIGCDGLSLSHGLTTPHMLVAEVGRIMVEVARRVIVVTDSSKLGRVGFTPIVPLAAVNTLITDRGAPPDLITQIQDLGIEVHLADDVPPATG